MRFCRSVGESYCAKNSRVIHRFTAFPPRLDTSYVEIQLFGSVHFNGCCVGLGDGSVRFISYQVDKELFRRLGNRHDGNVANLPSQ